MSNRRKKAVDLESCDIDFSAVQQQQQDSRPAKAAALLLHVQDEDERVRQQRQAELDELKAFDPSLRGYVAQHQQQAGRRRRTLFAKPSPAADGAAPVVEPESRAAQQEGAMDFVLQNVEGVGTTPQHLQARREAYESELREYCSRAMHGEVEAPKSAAEPKDGLSGDGAASHRFSLMEGLFAQGVPDLEPWDRWAYDIPQMGAPLIPQWGRPETITRVHADLLHHPVLPKTRYQEVHLQHRVEVPTKVMKTKDELRAEKRARIQQRQDAKRAEAKERVRLVEQDGTAGSSTTIITKEGAHDRLSSKSLAASLFADSVLNPIATENTVVNQYEERFRDHQLRNHERHVAALPQQIAKRERDRVRHAEERPLLRAYRIFPVFHPGQLAKLRGFANDNRLRGFVLWVAQCDALLVLSGGEVAMRHLDRWVLQKLRWEHPETHATRLFSVHLGGAYDFTFHAPSNRSDAKPEADVTAASGPHPPHEAVFMNFVESLAEGEAFLRQLPAPGSSWESMADIWRAAFLRGCGGGTNNQP